MDYINLYAYVGLEPGNGTDPMGQVGVSANLGADAYFGGGGSVSVGIGVSFTSERGFEIGGTGKIAAGGGYQLGVGLSGEFFLGNLSDKTGILPFVQGGGGVVAALSVPLTRDPNGRMSAGTPGPAGSKEFGKAKLAIQIKPSVGGSAGIQLERSFT